MYSFLANISHDLDKFNRLKPQKEKTKEKKTNVHNAALELYDSLLGTYFDEHFNLLDAEKSKMGPKNGPDNT